METFLISEHRSEFFALTRFFRRIITNLQSNIKRRVNPKIHDVIKKEVEKLLDADLIYPISDSPWVSPVHLFPKKGGNDRVKNEENELVPTRLVTGWRVCIDYRKLNEATCKDHFPLPFMDQMLERLLSGHGGQEALFRKMGLAPHNALLIVWACFGETWSNGHKVKVSILCLIKHSKKKLTEAPILIASDWETNLLKSCCDASDIA
ncbi:hypothetical protein Tco_1193810 [Tanacetum coccineum]